MDFRSGQVVTVRQKGTMTVRGESFTDHVFRDVTIVRENDDGTYQVQGIVAMPASFEVTVPADWIEAQI